METQKCLTCLIDLPLNKFSRSYARGKYYGYKKKCNLCGYNKYYRGKKYGKRFKWESATQEEKIEQTKKIFDSHVIKNKEGCWDWIGCRDKNGYGFMTYEKHHKNGHRISWFLTHGEFPEDKLVLHKCDNPPCTNPDHLFLGTPKDNHRDMVLKGRQIIKRGQDCKFSKLTEEDVKEIKKLLIQGLGYTQIGYKFGVEAITISAIKNGRAWKHVVID